MSATWQHNPSPPASRRRAGLIVVDVDGVLCPRQYDLSSITCICGISSPHFVAAAGTITNQRRPLVAPDPLPENWGTIQGVDAVADTMTMASHGYELGDGAVRFTAGTPPGGLSLGVDYWVIPVDANTFKLASSLANAYAGTAIDLTSTTTGATLSILSSSTRGLDGHFVYEATESEVKHDGAETIVIVDGTLNGKNFRRSSGAGAYSTVGHVPLIPRFNLAR